MRKIIDTREPITLTLAPATLEEELVQNIHCIMQTVKGEVPYMRGFGIDPAYLHRPIQAAETAYMVAIADAIEAYEPRINVNRISFSLDAAHPGQMHARLEVTFLDS